jgi:hypothetical protein
MFEKYKPMFIKFKYLFAQTYTAIVFVGITFLITSTIFQHSGGFFKFLGMLMPIFLYILYAQKYKNESWQKALIDATAGFFYIFSMLVTFFTAGIAIPFAIITFFCHLAAYGWLVERNLIIGWTADNQAQTYYNDILQICSQNNVNIEKGVPAKIIRDYLNTFVKRNYEDHFKETEFKKFIKEKLKDGKSFEINNNELLKFCNSLSPFFTKIYLKEYK